MSIDRHRLTDGVARTDDRGQWVKAEDCEALERKLANQVADLKRQLAAEREGRMRAEALLDDTRRANESLRREISRFPLAHCNRCDWTGSRSLLLDGEACPRCRLVL